MQNNRRKSGTVPPTGVEHPADVDVLFGRGRHIMDHPGNLAFRELVNSNISIYASCIRSEKVKISQSIVAAVYGQNGRFLRQDNKTNMWVDVGEKRSVKKTSQALREQQPKLQKEMGLLPTDQNGDNKKEEIKPSTTISTTTDLGRNSPFRTTTQGFVDASELAIEKATLLRASTSDGFSQLQRKQALNDASEEHIDLEKPSLDRACTTGGTFTGRKMPSNNKMNVSFRDVLKMSSDNKMNVSFREPLMPSPASSPSVGSKSAVLSVSRKIFDQDSMRSSFRDNSVMSLIDDDDDDDDDEDDYIETKPLCDIPKRPSLLTCMSAFTLTGMSQLSLMSGLSEKDLLSNADADNNFDRGLMMRQQLKKYDSVARIMKPIVESAPSNKSMLSKMSGISFTSIPSEADNVNALCKDLSLSGISFASINEPLKLSHDSAEEEYFC